MYSTRTDTEWFDQTLLERVLKIKAGSATSTTTVAWNLPHKRWTIPQNYIHSNHSLGLSPGLERLLHDTKTLITALQTEVPKFVSETHKLAPTMVIFPDHQVKGTIKGVNGDVLLNHADSNACIEAIKAELCAGALTNFNFAKSQTNITFAQNNLHLPTLVKTMQEAGFRLTGNDSETRKYLWRALFRLHPNPAEPIFRQLAENLMPLRATVARNWEIAVWGPESTHPLNRTIILLSPGHAKYVDMTEFQSKGGIMRPFPEEDKEQLKPLQPILDGLIWETLNQANKAELERLQRMNNPFANEQILFIRELCSRLDKEFKIV